MLQLDVKTLIGLARLSLSQTKAYLDHSNYKLRGSKIAVLNNDIQNPFHWVLEGSDITLTGMGESDDTILMSINGRGEKPFKVEKFIIVIFKEGKATYAVYNDE